MPCETATNRPAAPARAPRAARLLVALGLLLAAVLGTGSPAVAQSSPPPTLSEQQATSTQPTAAQGAPTPHIIPEPNTGHEPRDPGDRGGWWQEALFFGMCGGVLLMAAIVWRESRAERRRQGRPVTRAERQAAEAARRAQRPSPV